MEHPALAPAAGEALADARLTDRQRIGVLFQAACALALLESQGWTVPGWGSARLDRAGLLSGLAPEPARGDALPQKRLLELLRELFQTNGSPAGRGQGRRVARRLFERWRQDVHPIEPRQAVEDLLAQAQFLWEDEFARARACLAARASRNGRSELRLLGPGPFARAMAAGAEGLEEIRERLGRRDAREAWRLGLGNLDPRELAGAGHWRAAARAWDAAGAKTSEDRVDFARALYAVGRFEDALDKLKGLRRDSARILRLWCLYRLGRLGPAKRELGRLDRTSLEPRQNMQLLSVALRIFENRGLRREADGWLAEALRETDPTVRDRAELLAATNAWDRGDLEAMARRLGRVARALERRQAPGDLAWRFRKAAGLEASGRGDGAAAVEHFAEALRLARRRLTPFEAGALWNEMAIGRALSGDLAGAERALRHTLRLHREVQGSRTTTSALFNLAEIRLRRGSLAGVKDILERSTAEDRRARNWRSLAHDFELWARYELVRGRPHAALIRVREALDELAGRGISWRAEELHLLAGRALGWLERPEEARVELEAASRAAEDVLEAEEIPALWALAGDREVALARAPDGPLRSLWTRVLTGKEVDEAGWRALDRIEPYRAGRLVFDLELIVPGTAPPPLLRRAVVALREAGAGPLAERMDSRDATAWRALGSYLAGSQAGRRPDPRELERLFLDAGYPEARLVIRHATGEDVLRGARGGEHEISESLRRADLVLQAPYIDEVQKTLLAVLAQSFEGRDGSAAATSLFVSEADSSPSERGSGIVGESAALLEVLERARLLAAAEVPVMILGETGTGKELLAREVHARSRRRDGPFLAMNCAAVSEELLMSDLFGHVKGSFTGAGRDRAGIFETARDGTVFLDEIGDLPLRAQGFLLRVLQEGEVQRVGETLPRKVSVRVIAATHRDLEAMVRDGGFRADLYYRLRVGALALPPLRERGDDVLRLAKHFLRSDPSGADLDFATETSARLLAYDWPGNARELKNVLSVAAAFATGGTVLPEHLDLPYRTSRSERSGPSEPARRGETRTSAQQTPQVGYHEQVQETRRRLVRDALGAADGNRAEAARRLGLTRQALSYLVRKLELDS